MDFFATTTVQDLILSSSWFLFVFWFMLWCRAGMFSHNVYFENVEFGLAAGKCDVKVLQSYCIMKRCLFKVCFRLLLFFLGLWAIAKTMVMGR